MARIPAENIDLVAMDGIPWGKGQPRCVSFLHFLITDGRKRQGTKKKEEECESIPLQ